jgi:hypothetical protein
MYSSTDMMMNMVNHFMCVYMLCSPLMPILQDVLLIGLLLVHWRSHWPLILCLFFVRNLHTQAFVKICSHASFKYYTLFCYSRNKYNALRTNIDREASLGTHTKDGTVYNKLTGIGKMMNFCYKHAQYIYRLSYIFLHSIIFQNICSIWQQM